MRDMFHSLTGTNSGNMESLNSELPSLRTVHLLHPIFIHTDNIIPYQAVIIVILFIRLFISPGPVLFSFKHCRTIIS